MTGGRATTSWWPWLAIAAAALLLTLPAMLAPMKLHDSFWIDWVWTDQFADQLRAGILYPRWLPASHDGLGSPVFYYYPPLAFYPAGFLAAAGLTPYAAIVATFALAFAGSGAAMYAWLRGQAEHALAGALLFMAAPYHLADFYGRGALAETCAIAFMPLLALGLRRVSEGRGPALAALAYAGLICTHLPLALLASLFLVAPYALVLAKGRLRALVAFVPPLAIGIGLAAIYLVPALALEPYRDAAVLWSHDVLRPDHWLLTDWTITLDGMRLISLKVIAVAALPAAFLALRWRSFWAFHAVAMCLIVAGLLPYLWDLPLIRSVQFPFRALPIAEFAFVTAIALVPRGRIAAALVAPALALSATFLLAPAPDAMPATAADLATRHPDVPENLPPGERPYGWPSRWALALAAAHRAPVQQGAVTLEPVFYFPAWRVSCGGAEVPSFADPATGLLAHDGSNCRLALGWTMPEKVGVAISLAALLALLALIFRTRARRDG